MTVSALFPRQTDPFCTLFTTALAYSFVLANSREACPGCAYSTARHTSNAPLLSIEFGIGPRPPQPRPATSNGLPDARSLRPPSLLPRRASGKALALTGPKSKGLARRQRLACNDGVRAVGD